MHITSVSVSTPRASTAWIALEVKAREAAGKEKEAAAAMFRTSRDTRGQQAAPLD